MKINKRTWFILALIASMILATIACGSSADTQSGKPTKTSQPTKPPIPTQTPRPTDTPAPTKTPKPTDTPVPTLTPTQPPEPIILNGNGDSIADLSKWDGPAFLHVVGPNVQDNFIVQNLDTNNQTINLLINTIGAYDGYLLIDYSGEQTARFEINAGGAWTIEVYPISSEYIHAINIPGTYTGHGDDVIFLGGGGSPDTAILESTNNESNFIVMSVGAGYYDLLVNEIGAYTGTVLLSPDTWAITIQSEGDWTVQVTTR